MLPWRVGRACAIAGGLTGLTVGVFASLRPVGPWDADAWTRALAIPFLLLLLAVAALRARAGPTLPGRLGWLVLAAGASGLVATAAVHEPQLARVAALAGLVGAVAVGIVAGARRALPRGAAYAMLLAPLAYLLARGVTGAESAAAAMGFGLVFLVVGTTTID